MDNFIFIPTNNAAKERRRPGGQHFWDNFWVDFSQPTVYDQNKERLVQQVLPVLAQNVSEDAHLYAEVQYSEEARNKSKRPTQIWTDSRLSIVESTDDFKFTVSGKKEDFEKFEEILQSSTFTKAKGGTDIRPKDMTLSREIYAMSAIRDKNVGLQSRVDEMIMRLITLDSPDRIDCIIELQKDKILTEYESIYEQITNYLGVANEDEDIHTVEKRDRSALFSNLSYLAKLKVQQIRSLLEETGEFNFIRLIRILPNFSEQRSPMRIDLDGITINEPMTDEIIGIFDSGIASPRLRPLRFGTVEKFLKSHRTENPEHGTFVLSRALFGEDIESVIDGSIDTLNPMAKYLDVQVLYDDPATSTSKSDIDELMKALGSIPRKYPDVRLYNFSIADTNPIDDEHPSELTEKLDTVARERDVLFLCVTGNNDVYKIVEYDELFDQFANNTRILSPGDNASNLTVGSIAEKFDDDSSAPQENFPSPFSRTGVVRDDIQKPDLVANGGNYLKPSIISALPSEDYAHTTSLQRYGVPGLTTTDHPTRSIGTSQSAPLVTGQAASALDWIKKSNLDSRISCEGNYANLTKAVLVHSTYLKNLPPITDPHLRRAYGYGVADTTNVMKSSEDEVTVIYCDQLDGTAKKHKLLFELPDFVTSADLDFTFTLAYNPPVDRSFKEYTMINVSGTVRVPYEVTDTDTGEIKTKYNNLEPDTRWTNKKNSKSGLTHFSKRKRAGLTNNKVEVLVQMLAFEEYESKFTNSLQDMTQNYAICLTIKDLSQSGQLRARMMEMNQIEVLAPVEIEVSQ